MEAPLPVFVWGKSRVLPVRVTEFSVTEEAFDARLNPTRAKISLGMRVLTVDDLGFTHPGGLLYLLLFKAAGAFPVIVAEIAPHRARWALELGADAVIDPRTTDLASAVRDRTEGRGADVAVDAVGSVLRDAIMSVGKTGRVFTFGLNERATVTLEPAMLAYREISVHGVYIAKGTFPLAIRMLTDNRLGFDRLLTRSYPLDGVAEAIEELRSGEVAKGLLIP